MSRLPPPDAVPTDTVSLPVSADRLQCTTSCSAELCSILISSAVSFNTASTYIGEGFHINGRCEASRTNQKLQRRHAVFPQLELRLQYGPYGVEPGLLIFNLIHSCGPRTQTGQSSSVTQSQAAAHSLATCGTIHD